MFYGLIISGYGIAPTLERIKALKEANKPEIQSELKLFLGTVNWNASFITNLAELAIPLNELTHTRFVWTERHEIAFNNCKNALTTKSSSRCKSNWIRWYCKAIKSRQLTRNQCMLIQIKTVNKSRKELLTN